MSGGSEQQQQQQQPASSREKYAESMMNLMLLDPPRWGWTAMGGVADLLPPHERARRKTTKKAFLKSKKRQREKAALAASASAPAAPEPAPLPVGPPTSSSTTNAKASNSSTEPATSASLPQATNAAQSADAASGDPTPMHIDHEIQEPDSDKKQDGAEEVKVPSTENAGETVGEKEEPTATTEALPQSATNDSEEKNDDKQTAEATETTKSSNGEVAALEIATTTEPEKNDKPSETESELPPQASASKVDDAQPAAETEGKETAKPDEGTETAASKPEATEEKGATETSASKPTEDKGETTTTVPSGSTDADQKTNDDTNNTDNAEKSDSNEKEKVVTKTLREDGSIDIYAYHRGREGMEPRDEATGELLWDVPQTDTNYKWDEPRLSLQVTVSFPLCDEDVVQNSVSDIPRFEDTIMWDLGSPETMTPMAFAAKTAEEFGLSFGQTIDLATSIELQIFRHMQDYCGYPVPVAMSDGAGIERTIYPPPKIAQMYGGVFVREAIQPGTDLKNVVSSAPRSKQKGSNRTSSAGTHGSNTRRNPSSAKAQAYNRVPTYFNEAVDEKFLAEAKKRMTEYSREDCLARAAEHGHKPGLLRMRLNYVCHICHKRHDLVGAFGCGNSSHSYCVNHLQARLGLTARAVTDKVVCDHCPVCSCSCKCAKCVRRLDALAIELKRRSEIQGGTTPENTVFDEMFTTLTKPRASDSLFKDNVAANKRRESITSKASDEPKPKSAPRAEKPKSQSKAKAGPKASSGRKSEELLVRTAGPVTKAHPLDFPREFRGGFDCDPGTMIDYHTVYGPSGKYVKEIDFSKLVTPAKPDEVTVVEDGNVSECYTCQLGGNLSCCDYCPRAFHAACLENDRPQHKLMWECPACKREKEELPEYTLTGREAHPLICAAYSDIKTTTDDDLTQLSILSKMHEMAQKLISGDFGNIFAVPVDSKFVPDYPAVVKFPMDLGTIGSKLVDGIYKKFFDANQSWDDVHLAVLKDFELVWHNCLLYNVEGSAIYRMAKVLRRRMLAMRTRSIDRELSTSVKEKVEEYVKAKEKERGKIPRALDRPLSKHKIHVGAQKAGNATNVAVLDPDTGMIVKIYSTQSGAMKAAEDMVARGIEAEIKCTTGSAVKYLIKRSADDPSLTLFGYRWIEFKKLTSDQVVFAESEHSMYEMIDGESTTIFMSLDEALSDSRSGVPMSISQPQLKQALIELPKGGETSVSGVKWRRHESDGHGILMSSHWKEGRTATGTPSVVSTSSVLSSNATIAKEDVILRRTLGGYDTLDAAFEDWVLHCKNTGYFPDDEISRSSFHTYYLDGDRNVDGIVWKTVERADCQSTDGMQVEVAKPSKPEKQDGTVVSADNDPSNTGVTPCDGQDEPMAQSQAEAAVENIPTKVGTAPDVANDSQPVKSAADPAPASSGSKKRERSEEEVLQPRKK